MKQALIAACAAALLPAAAVSSVQQAAPDGVLIEHHYPIPAPPAAAWQALVHPELWWPEDHTWSGARANMRLAPAAGGCFCETWAGGSAEHARVVMAIDGKLLRLRGGFGPLQEMAVAAVLTVVLESKDDGTEAVVTYRISGDAAHRLDQLVPVVDQVIGQQFGAFAAYAGEMTRKAGK